MQPAGLAPAFMSSSRVTVRGRDETFIFSGCIPRPRDLQQALLVSHLAREGILTPCDVSRTFSPFLGNGGFWWDTWKKEGY